MVTREHEAPIELMGDMPGLVTLVMGIVGKKYPASTIAEKSSERCTDMDPPELLADQVFLIRTDGEPSGVVIVEVQRKKDDRKGGTWPSYLVRLWRERRLPVELLVICPNEGVAEWAGEPIQMGSRAVIVPWVFHPKMVPVPENLEQFGGSMDLMVFAMIMHANGKQAERALEAVLDTWKEMGSDEWPQYADYLYKGLPLNGRKMMEVMMQGTHEFQTYSEKLRADGLAEGEARGEIKGEARSLLLVLHGREFDVSDEVTERVMSCTDTALLESWLLRALTATSIDEVFAP